jgi:hypothetical protein
MEARGRIGRPTTAAKEGEKATLGIRASASLKGRLQEAAEVNGRSLSQEAEIRLEQSFKNADYLDQAMDLAYGPRFAELLSTLARAMRAAGSAAALNGEYSWDAVDRWTEIPYAFNEAFVAAITILEGRRPKGSHEWPETLLGTPAPEPRRKPGELGEKLARDVLRSGPARQLPQADPAIAESWDRALEKANARKSEGDDQ